MLLLGQDTQVAEQIVKQLTKDMVGQASKEGNVIGWVLAVVVGALLTFFYYLIRQSESKDKMFMDYVKEMKDDNKEFQKEAVLALKDNSNTARVAAQALAEKIDGHTDRVVEKVDSGTDKIIQAIHQKRSNPDDRRGS